MDKKDRHSKEILSIFLFRNLATNGDFFRWTLIVLGVVPGCVPCLWCGGCVALTPAGAGDRRAGLGRGIPGHGGLCWRHESTLWVRSPGLCHLHCWALGIHLVRPSSWSSSASLQQVVKELSREMTYFRGYNSQHILRIQVCWGRCFGCPEGQGQLRLQVLFQEPWEWMERGANICTHISISTPNVCCFIFPMKCEKPKKNPLWFEADNSINPKCVVCFGRAFSSSKSLKDLFAPFYTQCKILVDLLGMSRASLLPCRAYHCGLLTASIPLALYNLDNTSGFKIVHLALRSWHRYWWGRYYYCLQFLITSCKENRFFLEMPRERTRSNWINS